MSDAPIYANPGPQPGNPNDQQARPAVAGGVTVENDANSQGSIGSFTSGANDPQVSPGSGDPFLPGFEPENNEQSPGGRDQTFVLVQEGLAAAQSQAVAYNESAGQFLSEGGGNGGGVAGHTPVGGGAADPGSEPAKMVQTVPDAFSPPPQPDIS